LLPLIQADSLQNHADLFHLNLFPVFITALSTSGGKIYFESFEIEAQNSEQKRLMQD
jgi:hypothetical protein